MVVLAFEHGANTMLRGIKEIPAKSFPPSEDTDPNGIPKAADPSPVPDRSFVAGRGVGPHSGLRSRIFTYGLGTPVPTLGLAPLFSARLCLRGWYCSLSPGTLAYAASRLLVASDRRRNEPDSGGGNGFCEAQRLGLADSSLARLKGCTC